jgi:hypothetical protein
MRREVVRVAVPHPDLDSKHADCSAKGYGGGICRATWRDQIHRTNFPENFILRTACRFFLRIFWFG